MNEQAIKIAVTETELANFINDLAAKVNEYEKEHYPDTGVLFRSVFSYTVGKKYARICKKCIAHTGKGSAYAFIRLEDGAILKPAGYKTPAKGVRGNIRLPFWLTACNPFSVAYLR